MLNRTSIIRHKDRLTAIVRYKDRRTDGKNGRCMGCGRFVAFPTEPIHFTH